MCQHLALVTRGKPKYIIRSTIQYCAEGQPNTQGGERSNGGVSCLTRLTRCLAVANSSTAREQARVRAADKGLRTASQAALWLPAASARQTDEQ